MSGSRISGIEYYLPKKKENNKDLKKINPSWDIKRLYEKTGINTRYISASNENVIDIAEKSISKTVLDRATKTNFLDDALGSIKRWQKSLTIYEDPQLSNVEMVDINAAINDANTKPNKPAGKYLSMTE